MATANHTSVYLYFDASDILIYVGITSRGIKRQREHERDKPWWGFTRRQEIEHFDNKEDAIERERSLIATYSPPFNTQHNTDSSQRDAYLRLSDSQGVTEAPSKRIPLRVAGVWGDSLVAVTTMEFSRAAALVAPVGDFVVATPGQRVKGVEVRRVGSALAIRVTCPRPSEISGGTLMYRIQPHGRDIKRIDFATGKGDVKARQGTKNG